MLSKLSNYDILFKIGYSYYILGDYIRAENFLKKTRLSDYREDSNYYLGLISMEKGNHKLAINYLDNINKFLYKNAIKYYLLLLYYNEREYEKILFFNVEKASKGKKN